MSNRLPVRVVTQIFYIYIYIFTLVTQDASGYFTVFETFPLARKSRKILSNPLFYISVMSLIAFTHIIEIQFRSFIFQLFQLIHFIPSAAVKLNQNQTGIKLTSSI